MLLNRADGSQLALLSATEDDSFHPLAVIETIKKLGDLRSAAFRCLPLSAPPFTMCAMLLLLVVVLLYVDNNQEVSI